MNELGLKRSANDKARMILEYGEDKAIIERLRLEKLYLLEAIEDLNDTIGEVFEYDSNQMMASIDKILDAKNCYEIRAMLPINHRL